MFISIDGIDGCGKSSVATTLYEKLKLHCPKADIQHIHDPRFTAEGNELYKMMCRNFDFNSNNASYFHMALARYYLLRDLPIQVFNEDNFENIVVCERGILSSLVYQPDADHKVIDELLHIHIWNFNVAFVLDIPAKQAARRIIERQGRETDIFDESSIDAMEDRRRAYLNSKRTFDLYNPHALVPIHIINCENKTVDEIVDIIIKEL